MAQLVLRFASRFFHLQHCVALNLSEARGDWAQEHQGGALSIRWLNRPQRLLSTCLVNNCRACEVHCEGWQ